jgi:hypothetical protein
MVFPFLPRSGVIVDPMDPASLALFFFGRWEKRCGSFTNAHCYLQFPGSQLRRTARTCGPSSTNGHGQVFACCSAAIDSSFANFSECHDSQSYHLLHLGELDDDESDDRGWGTTAVPIQGLIAQVILECKTQTLREHFAESKDSLKV